MIKGTNQKRASDEASQFDTAPELYAKVESVCSMLDCSKRQFLEMAVVDAINKAESVFAETYKQASGRELGEEV